MKFLLTTLCCTLILNLSAQVWKSHNPPFPDTIGIADIEVVSERVVWAVGVRYDVNDSLYNYFGPSKTYVARTQDGGTTWSVDTVPMGSNPFVARLSALDGTTAWVAGLNNFGNSKVLKTTDGGKTWKDNSPPFDPAISWVDYVHAISSAKVVIIGDPRDGEFEIYNTGNAGAVWTKISGANIPDPLPNEFGYNNCGAAIGNTIWFGTNKGRIFRSRNAGLNWEVFETPLGEVFGNFSFSDENNGIIATSYGFGKTSLMYRTTDGGATWQQLENLPYNGKFLNFNIAAYIPNSPFLVQGLAPGFKSNLTGPYETWVSSDRGDTWKQVSTGELIGWPTFLDNKTGWAGDFQQLKGKTRLHQYIGSPFVGLFSPSKFDAAVTLSPNPAHNLIQVQVSVGRATDFWLLLNDAQGRLWHKIEVTKTAVFSETIDLKTLPPGLYTLTILSEKGSVVHQVIKK